MSQPHLVVCSSYSPQLNPSGREDVTTTSLHTWLTEAERWRAELPARANIKPDPNAGTSFRLIATWNEYRELPSHPSNNT